jgi:hypothetical protein
MNAQRFKEPLREAVGKRENHEQRNLVVTWWARFNQASTGIQPSTLMVTSTFVKKTKGGYQ